MRKQYPVVGVCLASALFLALQARAQDTVPQESKPVETVQQETTDVAQPSTLPEDMASGDVMQMDAITVTATRQEEKILNVPQTINVITRQTMDDHNVNNIEEMLRHTPGVHVDRQTSLANSAFGGSGSITMRGVGGNRILTVVDGDRVMESAGVTGDVGNRMFVDTQMLKAAEISRGPASTLWGADAMGGMVSYQTLDPEDLLKGDVFGGKALVGFDNLNDGKTEHGAFAVQMNDKLQALLGYTHRTHKETRLGRARDVDCGREGFSCSSLPPLHEEINNVLGKIVYRPNQDHQFKLTGEFFESNARSQIPFLTSTGAAFGSGGDHRRQDQTRWRFALEHKWDVNADWLDNVKWRLSYSEQEREVDRNQDYVTKPTDYKAMYPTMWQMFAMMGVTDANGIAPGKPTHARRITNYETDAYQADIQLTSSFDAWNTSHKLTYGFQGDLMESSYSLKNTDYLTGVTTKDAEVGNSMSPYFVDSDTTRADLYIQDEIKLFDDRLTLTPGLRRAHYSLDPSGGGISIEGHEPRKISENRWLPQFGALFKLTDTYSVYARYAKGFKMPTAQQLFMSFESDTRTIIPNADLKPETSDSYEVGFRGKYDDAWFSIGAFYTDYDDFIATMQQIGPTTYSSENINRVKIWGVEASGEWQFARNWSLTGSVDWQYARQEDDDGEKNPWLVPPLTAVTGVKWKLPEYGLTTELFGTFARKVSRVDKDSNGNDNFKPGGYAVFDGYVNWQMTKNLKLTASVNNILNKRYFDYTAGGTSLENKTNATNPLELFTAPGRTFAVSLQATF